MGNRKGQVTVFIIIGIIALVSVSTFLYMRSAKVEAPVSYRPTIEQIPVEAEPIRQFIQSCLRQAAEDGLHKVGDHGGYTSEENMAANYNPGAPTEGDAIQFSPGSSLIVPYWWHMKSDNDCFDKREPCEFSSRRPNLFRQQGGTNIEENLDEFVNENLQSCLRGFVDLEGYGFEISETGQPQTTTIVTEKTVAFELSYPLVARKGGVTYNLNNYYVDIELNLKDIYTLATDIANFQANYNILENYIKNIIALYSRVDSNALPPFSGSGVDLGGGEIWIKNQVERQLKGILMSYIPMLYVSNTRTGAPRNFPEGTPHRRALYTLYNTNMLIPVLNNTYPNLETSFMYFDWWDPIYFDLNCDGQICKSQAGDAMSSLVNIGIQRYQFYYDLSLPVLVEINNPFAFQSNGYSFKFFMEANMRNNNPLANLPVQEPLGDAEPPSRTMLCDKNKRLSTNITVEVIDIFNATGVPGARIAYSCGGETCKIGETGPDGKMTAHFPVCLGGVLNQRKQDYLGSGTLLSTVNKDPFTVRLTTSPMLKRDIEIRKYVVREVCTPIYVNATGTVPIAWDCNWEMTFQPVKLSPSEEATVTLKRKTGPGESDFFTAATWFGDEPMGTERSNGIQIVPGDYEVNIFVMDRKELIIPEDERCESQEIAGIEYDEECFTIEGVEFNEENPFMSGGIELADVSLTASQLRDADKIVFYAVTFALDEKDQNKRVIEDLSAVSDVSSYSETYRRMFLPTYEEYDETDRGARTGTI